MPYHLFWQPLMAVSIQVTYDSHMDFHPWMVIRLPSAFWTRYPVFPSRTFLSGGNNGIDLAALSVFPVLVSL